MHIIDISFCILFYIFNCILCILYIMHIVHIEHIYSHIVCVRPWLCPSAIHIMHIFWHIMHIILHIYWYILHIGSMTYCAYPTFLLTYFLKFAYFAYNAYRFYAGHILHNNAYCIFYVRCLFPLLLDPPSKVQLFTYLHLHPSPLFWLLSQEAPGKSADSLCMSKGIVPFSPNKDCFRWG